jgi:hypothetical protein
MKTQRRWPWAPRKVARRKAEKPESRIERCRREIRLAEAELRAGHGDVHGLCLALADWSKELRLLLAEFPCIIPHTEQT